MENNFIRLEYNEQQGGFHFDNGTHKKDSFGWHCICENITEEQANEFADFIAQKYPDTEWTKVDRCNFPTTSTIKKEFVNFLLSIPA
jgi:hypothetical protein